MNRSLLRRLRGPIAVVGTWLVLDRVFTAVAGHEGLLASFGSVHLGTALLGFIVLALRLIVTFAVLPWVAFRLQANSANRAAPPAGALEVRQQER